MISYWFESEWIHQHVLSIHPQITTFTVLYTLFCTELFFALYFKGAVTAIAADLCLVEALNSIASHRNLLRRQ